MPFFRPHSGQHPLRQNFDGIGKRLVGCRSREGWKLGPPPNPRTKPANSTSRGPLKNPRPPVFEQLLRQKNPIRWTAMPRSRRRPSKTMYQRAHYPHSEDDKETILLSVPMLSDHTSRAAWKSGTRTARHQGLRPWAMEPMPSGGKSIMVSDKAG